MLRARGGKHRSWQRLLGLICAFTAAASAQDILRGQERSASGPLAQRVRSFNAMGGPNVSRSRCVSSPGLIDWGGGR